MLSRRFFEWLLDHRAWVVVLGIALCAVSIYAGRNVRADYAVSQFFPVWDPERLGYEEFKDVFPKEAYGDVDKYAGLRSFAIVKGFCLRLGGLCRRLRRDLTVLRRRI